LNDSQEPLIVKWIKKYLRDKNNRLPEEIITENEVKLPGFRKMLLLHALIS
jgi:hypothetical protein